MGKASLIRVGIFPDSGCLWTCRFKPPEIGNFSRENHEPSSHHHFRPSRREIRPKKGDCLKRVNWTVLFELRPNLPFSDKTQVEPNFFVVKWPPVKSINPAWSSPWGLLDMISMVLAMDAMPILGGVDGFSQRGSSWTCEKTTFLRASSRQCDKANAINHLGMDYTNDFKASWGMSWAHFSRTRRLGQACIPTTTTMQRHTPCWRNGSSGDQMDIDRPRNGW